MASVYQEIHCPKSGGGCGGYFTMRVNVELNKLVDMVCPKCGHKHRRCVKDGQIIEEGRYQGGRDKEVEELHTTIAAWSEKPRTKCMHQMAKKKDYSKERDGVVIASQDDLLEPVSDPAQAIVRESWAERFAGRLIGK